MFLRLGEGRRMASLPPRPLPFPFPPPFLLRFPQAFFGPHCLPTSLIEGWVKSLVFRKRYSWQISGVRISSFDICEFSPLSLQGTGLLSLFPGSFSTTTATSPAESSCILQFYSGLGFTSHGVSPSGSMIPLADYEEAKTLFIGCSSTWLCFVSRLGLIVGWLNKHGWSSLSHSWPGSWWRN